MTSSRTLLTRTICGKHVVSVAIRCCGPRKNSCGRCLCTHVREVAARHSEKLLDLQRRVDDVKLLDLVEGLNQLLDLAARLGLRAVPEVERLHLLAQAAKPGLQEGE